MKIETITIPIEERASISCICYIQSSEDNELNNIMDYVSHKNLGELLPKDLQIFSYKLTTIPSVEGINFALIAPLANHFVNGQEVEEDAAFYSSSLS